jgi:hypothetical protein
MRSARWRLGSAVGGPSRGMAAFRSSHSARTLAEEAEEHFSLDEYMRRKSAFGAQKPGGPAPFDPHDTYGVRAEFGKPTDEDTRTWGNSQIIQFVATPENLTLPTVQLIHVARRRPTSFNIITVVTFGQGWLGTADACDLNIIYIMGVGQTSISFINTLTIADPEPGSSFFHVDQFPLNAVQTQAQILVHPTNTGATYVTQVAQLAAPVFE